MNTNQDTTLTNQDAFEITADIVGLDTTVLGNSKTREFEYADISTHRAYLCHLAATKASESEINSLKQRVVELQADNLRLREYLVSASNYVPTKTALRKWINAVITSTPTQSLAEHDNE